MQTASDFEVARVALTSIECEIVTVRMYYIIIIKQEALYPSRVIIFK